MLKLKPPLEGGLVSDDETIRTSYLLGVNVPPTAEADHGSYALARVMLGARFRLQLKDDEVDALKSAIVVFDEVIDVEQKLDILIANFVELETEMANRAIRQAYHSSHSAEEMFDDKQALNRRVANLLSAARLYVDQAKQHFGVIFAAHPELQQQILEQFSAEYDASLSYRVMDALRNYAQHKGLPLHGMTHGGRWLEWETPKKRLEQNIKINIQHTVLREDGAFKRSVLQELEATGDVTDIKPMIREYVAALGRVHELFRTVSAPLLDSAQALFRGWQATFMDNVADVEVPVEFGSVGIALVKLGERGGYEVLSYLPNEQVDYLSLLRARNRNLTTLQFRFVTTEPAGF